MLLGSWRRRERPQVPFPAQRSRWDHESRSLFTYLGGDFLILHCFDEFVLLKAAGCFLDPVCIRDTFLGGNA